eukprot:Skav216646  [mRNA]  locus=scaffold1255:243076:243725:- [translate_table: standard]
MQADLKPQFSCRNLHCTMNSTTAPALAVLSANAVRRTASMTNTGQSMKLNLFGFIKFSGSASSTQTPRRAQAATKPIRGSALGAANANRATITAMPARQTIANISIVAGDDMLKSAMTLMFSALAATIHPQCNEKGALNKKYSFTEIWGRKSTRRMPVSKLRRIPNMQTKDPAINS